MESAFAPAAESSRPHMTGVQVSILMAVYNGEAYLAEALDSIRAQTHGNFEALIVDDGSSDRTPEIVACFAARDRRFRYVRQDKRGMAAALNLGLTMVHNDIVARMDADDRMLPTRLERQLRFLLAHPEIAVLSSLVFYINEKGDTFGYTKEVIEAAHARAAAAKGELIGFNHPAVMMRRSAIRQAGGYRGKFWPVEDLDLWARLAERGLGIATLPEYLLEYRIHRMSASVTQSRLALRKTGWAHACMQARLAGREEPSWNAYRSSLGCFPSIRWIGVVRSEAAAITFKQGVVWLSLNKRGRAVMSLTLSALLSPSLLLAKARLKAPLWPPRRAGSYPLQRRRA